MKTVESDLKFLDYKIISFEYISVIDEQNTDIKYEVTIAPKLSKPQEITDGPLKGHNMVKVNLTVKIRGKVGKRMPVKLKCEILGLFVSEKLSQENIIHFCATSGVANLLSIVRSIVISFTSQTGNKPIIMPLINLLQTYKKNIQKKSSNNLN